MVLTIPRGAMFSLRSLRELRLTSRRGKLEGGVGLRMKESVLKSSQTCGGFFCARAFSVFPDKRCACGAARRSGIQTALTTEHACKGRGHLGSGSAAEAAPRKDGEVGRYDNCCIKGQALAALDLATTRG